MKTYPLGVLEKRETEGRKLLPQKGEIMEVARSPVVTVAPSTPIIDVIKIMTREGFRRLPVINPATRELEGIAAARDIVDYLGGGRKYKIIEMKYDGNFFPAVYAPVEAIMSKKAVSLRATGRIGQAINLMIKRGVGGIPVVDRKKRVWAIVTERDLLHLFSKKLSGKKIEETMSKDVATISPDTTLRMASRKMIREGFRRLPIVDDKKLIGIVTVRDIVRFFGTGEVYRNLKSGAIGPVLDTLVHRIGTRGFVTVAADLDVAEAAKLMIRRGVGALPVLDEKKRLVGIITERDLVKMIRKMKLM
jgi:CBS domain-containing protein